MNSKFDPQRRTLRWSIATRYKRPQLQLPRTLAQSVGPRASSVGLGEGAKRDALRFLSNVLILCTTRVNCRGGTPWPPVVRTGSITRTGGHGVPPLQLTSSGRLRFGTAILQCSPDIYERKTELENDECVRAVVPTPDDPQHVAQQEQPESPVAFELSLRANHPRGNHGDHHGRPLAQIKHLNSSRIRRA